MAVRTACSAAWALRLLLLSKEIRGQRRDSGVSRSSPRLSSGNVSQATMVISTYRYKRSPRPEVGRGRAQLLAATRLCLGGLLFSPVDHPVQSRRYPVMAVPVCLSRSVCGHDPILRRTALKLVAREFCKWCVIIGHRSSGVSLEGAGARVSLGHLCPGNQPRKW